MRYFVLESRLLAYYKKKPQDNVGGGRRTKDSSWTCAWINALQHGILFCGQGTSTWGSLLQRFVDGDDDFRNSRLKLIPSVPKDVTFVTRCLSRCPQKGFWIVRQSIGSTPCLLGKVVDCNYIRGPKYLEVDVDIGSSTVANGVLGLVIGVITTLVVDMAFLVQANTTNELPERLISAVRVSHLELSAAIVPVLQSDPSD